MLISVPFWNSNFYYTLSDSKLYCTYPFADRNQLGASAFCVLHSCVCLSIICFCYSEIYKFYRLAGKRKHSTANKKESVLQSIAFKEDTSKKDEANEFRVFLTTVILIGWTMIGKCSAVSY